MRKDLLALGRQASVPGRRRSRSSRGSGSRRTELKNVEVLLVVDWQIVICVAYRVCFFFTLPLTLQERQIAWFVTLGGENILKIPDVLAATVLASLRIPHLPVAGALPKADEDGLDGARIESLILSMDAGKPNVGGTAEGTKMINAKLRLEHLLIGR